MINRSHKVAVVGDLAEGVAVYSGQTAKTRDYYYFLAEKYGKENITPVDTRYWKTRLFSVTYRLLSACSHCDIIVLLLCSNGRKTILPLVMMLRKIFKYKILFSIIGALPDNVEKEHYFMKHFDEIDGVYVETKKLQKRLNDQGHFNVYYAPVFSRRVIDENIVTAKTFAEPYKLCTYSRVCAEKGISDAIDAVVEVNKREGRQVCILDVFGPPIGEYKEEFERKIVEANGCVFNKPLLTDEDALITLSEHYLMLFPTRWKGEGFPIALVECMKSGLPVIATDWNYNSEIIHNGVTGMIYQSGEKNALVDNIIHLIHDPVKVSKMKQNCIEESKIFDPHNIMEAIFCKIDE